MYYYICKEICWVDNSHSVFYTFLNHNEREDFIMCINDKVVFDGDIYVIIYDYKNGSYEIRNEQTPRKVHLVKETEIYAL
jgi:hypothetical protein